MIGAVIIKHKLCLSDRETVAQIQENPYLQYFVGLPGYQRRLSRELSPKAYSYAASFSSVLDRFFSGLR